MEGDVRNLTRHGLIEQRTIEGHSSYSTKVFTLTKNGQRLLERAQLVCTVLLRVFATGRVKPQDKTWCRLKRDNNWLLRIKLGHGNVHLSSRGPEMAVSLCTGDSHFTKHALSNYAAWIVREAMHRTPCNVPGRK